MPFVGLGLHTLIALFFAIHAVRSGQQLYWLIVLFSFPLLGSAAYFFVIYLPNSRLERGVRQAVSAAARTLDPGKEVREARALFDYTPTVQNQMRLACALLNAGQPDEAVKNYAACLKGPFASDLEMRLGAAKAYLACAQPAQALEHLGFIRQTDPNFRAEQLALLMAQALAAAGRQQEAGAEFESARDRFGSFECRAEYAIWAATTGQQTLAAQLHSEVQQSMARWNRQTKELNADLLQRFKAAFERVGPRA